MSVWDDPEIRAGGEFVKLEHPGDAVRGTIQAIRAHRFDDGKVAPQVLLTTDEGEEKTLTAGQVRLKAMLAEQRPEAGDWIQVTLTGVEPRAGGKSLKHWDVQIRRGNGQPAAAAPAVPGPQWGSPAPAPAPQQWTPPVAPPAAPAPQQWTQPAAPVPNAAPAQQYAPPAAAAPVQQQYAPPAAPAAPVAQPVTAPPAQQQTPEQAAAIAGLTPEQRAALGIS